MHLVLPQPQAPRTELTFPLSPPHPLTAMSLIRFLALVLFASLPAIHGADLKIGFYNKSCPSAETLVQQVVAKAFANSSAVAPGLIRMHFHDCFVRGCDGSVLIDSTPGNSAEKDAPPNNPSLHGFDVIDAAKSAVEAQCPNIVSCADVLAFAARDSAALTGNITYKVPAGRRDGRVSNATEASNNLPSPRFNATQLVANFAAKNLTADDMVTLSGAHTLGVSHCSSFLNRIYNFSSATQVDPTLSSAYAVLLQSKCPTNTTATTPITVALDIITPTVLDNKYYVGLQLTLGLLTSDQALLTNATLSDRVNHFSDHPGSWATEFERAMVKMGGIEVLTGTQGEIRKNCRVVNSGSLGSVVSDSEVTGFASS